jgi:hypothetical protein
MILIILYYRVGFKKNNHTEDKKDNLHFRYFNKKKEMNCSIQKRK